MKMKNGRAIRIGAIYMARKRLEEVNRGLAALEAEKIALLREIAGLKAAA